MPRRTNKDLEMLETWKEKGFDLAKEFGIEDPTKRFRSKLRKEIQDFVKAIPDRDKLIELMQEEMVHFLSRDRFWERTELDAFKATMRKKSKHAYFCTDMKSNANTKKSIKIPPKSDMLFGFFNRGDTVKKVGLEIWYAVPETYHMDEYVIEPGHIVFLWSGAFPLMQHMSAHASPTLHRIDETTWDDLYLIQGYLDFEGRWKFYNHTAGFQISDVRVQFSRGLAFRLTDDEPWIHVPYVPTIEYPPFHWKDRNVFEPVSLVWEVSETDYDSPVRFSWCIGDNPC